MSAPHVSDADRLRWQLEAVRWLADLLSRARGEGLPALGWSLGFTGTLVGRVLYGEPATRRDVFEQWAALVGADQGAERDRRDGAVELYASRLTPWGSTVAISATVFPDLPAEGGER
ncbi:hypothetical protein BAY59_36540 [Prauserella coralliicola]|nr:hypothetical protein BAY59_36540 [Prauserella coralliicola]